MQTLASTEKPPPWRANSITSPSMLSSKPRLTKARTPFQINGGQQLVKNAVCVYSISFQHERKKMLRGSCCCGTIKFALSSPPTMMGTCHCTRCRKIGASTFVFVKRDSFELLSGAESITTYKPLVPYKYNRCFCSRCGTSLGEVTSSGDSFPVAANCFDDEIELTNFFHEFVKEKPKWYCICDEAKQFMEHPHQ